MPAGILAGILCIFPVRNDLVGFDVHQLVRHPGATSVIMLFIYIWVFWLRRVFGVFVLWVAADAWQIYIF